MGKHAKVGGEKGLNRQIDRQRQRERARERERERQQMEEKWEECEGMGGEIKVRYSVDTRERA